MGNVACAARRVLRVAWLRQGTCPTYLHGDGRFVLNATGGVSFFGDEAVFGATRLKAAGNIIVTDTCLRADNADVTCELDLGPIDIDGRARGSAWLGPGPRFGLDAEGTIGFWGARADARLHLDERGLALEAAIDATLPDLLGGNAKPHVKGHLAGIINLLPSDSFPVAPTFALRGDGSVTIQLVYERACKHKDTKAPRKPATKRLF